MLHIPRGRTHAGSISARFRAEELCTHQVQAEESSQRPRAGARGAFPPSLLPLRPRLNTKTSGPLLGRGPVPPMVRASVPPFPSRFQVRRRSPAFPADAGTRRAGILAFTVAPPLRNSVYSSSGHRERVSRSPGASCTRLVASTTRRAGSLTWRTGAAASAPVPRKQLRPFPGPCAPRRARSARCCCSA